MMDEVDWWVRWSTASKGSKSLVPDLLRQAPYLVFSGRKSRGRGARRWLRFFLAEGAEVVERRAREERLGVSGRSCRQSSRGQRDGDSGQSVSEVSGSARRSSAGNGGKRVPLGAGGSAGDQAGVDGQGRVVEYGRVLATRGAAVRRSAYSNGTAPCRRYWPGTYRRQVLRRAAARACEQLIVCQAVAGTWAVVSAWCAVVVRRVPISRAPPRCAGGAVRSSLTAAASTQQPPGAAGGCPPACAAIRLVRRCSLEMEMPERGLGTLPSAK